MLRPRSRDLISRPSPRQVNAGTLSAESVVAIARAYDADPIQGLIILGLVTEDDVRRHGFDVLLSDTTDRMLSEEVWNRMQEGRVVASDDVASGVVVQFPRGIRADEIPAEVAAHRANYSEG